jgi:hypothetical protein
MKKNKNVLLLMLSFSILLNPTVSAQPKYDKEVGVSFNYAKGNIRGLYLAYYFNKPNTKSMFGLNVNYYKYGNDYNSSHFRTSANYSYRLVQLKKILKLSGVAGLSYVEFKHFRNYSFPMREKGIGITIGPRIEIPAHTRFSLGAEGGIGPYFFNTYNEFGLQYQGGINQVVRLDPYYQTGFYGYYIIYLKIILGKKT